MVSFILGLASGLFYAAMSAVSKKSLANTNYFLAAFSQSFFALPFFLMAIFLPGLAWVQPIDTAGFWWPTIGKVITNIIASLMFMKALGMSKLSLIVPLLSFTPLFLILTSNLMLGEFPSVIGITGIILIVLGTYVLNLDGRNILSPIKAIFQNKGALLALGAAAIWAVTTSFDKMGVQASSPVTFLLISESLTAAVILLLIWRRPDVRFQTVKKNLWWLFGIGIFSAASLISQMVALQLNLVSYIVALKRTSGLFAVIIGYFAFKERNVKAKLIGAAIMATGVLLISLS